MCKFSSCPWWPTAPAAPPDMYPFVNDREREAQKPVRSRTFEFSANANKGCCYGTIPRAKMRKTGAAVGASAEERPYRLDAAEGGTNSANDYYDVSRQEI